MRVILTTRPRGLVATVIESGPSTFGYDAAGRLASQAMDFAGTTGDVAWSFTHTPASQLASETRDNDLYAWTGHANATQAYTANGLNEYTAVGGATLAYDANGNLTSDGSKSYTYDIENRLVGASNGAALRYDPMGRLYEISGGSAGTQRLLYDGDALVAEYNSAGTMLRRYVHSTGADTPFLWIDVDPIGYEDQVNLYAYVGGDPVNGRDPSGRETQYVYKNRIVVVQTVKLPKGSQFNDASLRVAGTLLSGTRTDGTKVEVRLENSSKNNPVKVKIDKKLDDSSADSAMRSHADRIGGRKVTADDAATDITLGHEIGHSLGMGDQYSGGIDVNGNTLGADISGPGNLAKDRSGNPVNAQSLDEITAPADRVINCVVSEGDSMPKGC